MIIPPYYRSSGLPEARCGRCGASSTDVPIYDTSLCPGSIRTAEPIPTNRCLPCWEAEVEGNSAPCCNGPMTSSQALSNLARILEDFLRVHGMESESLHADPTLVPAAYARCLIGTTRESINTLIGGYTPATGVCIAGSTDTGKTMTVAAWCIQWAANYLRRNLPMEHYRVSKHPYRIHHEIFIWAAWIETYAEWSNDNSIHGSVEDLGSVPLLVLDDLGSETPHKIFGEDLGRVGLERLIDMRDRKNLPTIITTNLTEKEIYMRYGDRTARRIFRLNPYVLVKDLQPMGRINHKK